MLRSSEYAAWKPRCLPLLGACALGAVALVLIGRRSFALVQELQTDTPTGRSRVAALVTEEEPAAIVSRVEMISRSDVYFLSADPGRWLGPRTVQDLRRLLLLTPDQVSQLAASSDGRKQSLAIFILWQRGETRELLTIAEKLIDSQRAAVPYRVDSDSAEPRWTEKQTVGEYTRCILGQWVGGLPSKRFPPSEFFSCALQTGECERFVDPWIWRLGRAKQYGTPAESERVLSLVREIPTDAQAVVVTLAVQDGLIDSGVARKIVQSLPSDATEVIRSRSDFLPTSRVAGMHNPFTPGVGDTSPSLTP
jgi:hypothetical protein